MTSEKKDAHYDDLSDYDRDKLRKQRLVIEALQQHCSASSPHHEIRQIADAFKEGKAELVVVNLSGGYTNYTYQVYLRSDSEDQEREKVTLFVKLCFPRAFWNPDPSYVYDLERIVNESHMMGAFAKIAPGCAATPYLLLDIVDGDMKMKLLATEWSPSNCEEQIANQFIDGVADNRVAEKMGVALAALHCSENGIMADDSFNTEARECMIDLFSILEEELVKLVSSVSDSNNSNSKRRSAQLALDFGGKDFVSELIQSCTKSYRDCDIPIHTDLHAFNILVEKKPSVLNLEQFGPNGSFCICDWEMAMKGPLGLDMGRIYSIPVSCIIAHAYNENDSINNILAWIAIYWKEYSSALTGAGKDSTFLHMSYRNGMAWLGWKLYAMSIMGLFIPFLGVEDSDLNNYKESLAVIGIKLMWDGFCCGEKNGNRTLDELIARLDSTIRDEVAYIQSSKSDVGTAAAQQRRTRRRSSILRETNKRISDSFQTMDRMSLKKAIEAHVIEELDLDSVG